MVRKMRKQEHIELYLETFDKKKRNFFDDFKFVHNSLPETDIKEINIETTLFNRIKIRSPFFINAITGGTLESKEINKVIAHIAKEMEIPMAVGSQYITLEDESTADSFKIARQVNPDGIIFANAGAMISVESANKMIDMVEADALQIHLNVPQEVMMDEGDRCFKGYIANIEKLVAKLKLPIIVKEVGFGISGETAKILADIGVHAIDIGGKGGTNFIEIENKRSDKDPNNIFLEWGIPTGVSLVECIKSVPNKIDIIASGGIWDGLSVAKALSIGAKAVGIAGLILYLLIKEGKDKLINTLKNIENELIISMLMLGSKNINELKKCPIIITGESKEWLELRGYEVYSYARR
ncbi:MAG TPA: type 2 isopentenyl-diphosphate Delta-isomerase [Thermoanaerobacterales bacterium]|nr:type 2 isopentenyl-diphosphate Delta-isomerase [Thermoanaerobacterales bacterium]